MANFALPRERKTMVTNEAWVRDHPAEAAAELNRLEQVEREFSLRLLAASWHNGLQDDQALLLGAIAWQYGKENQLFVSDSALVRASLRSDVTISRTIASPGVVVYLPGGE